MAGQLIDITAEDGGPFQGEGDGLLALGVKLQYVRGGVDGWC